MKTRHLLRHIQRALARVIGELTSQGIGYTGPEQTDERRIPGSGNRSCLGCRRTYQPFMQGRRPADDQQHRRAERRLSGALPVYAAPDQDVCGVDMSLNSVHAVAV